jgi:glycerol-3-phosphate dehydrogenase (NAD(P)+)
MLGAGSWGTTIAVHLARNGRRVNLWGRSRAALDEMRLLNENRTYLPGVTIPEGVTPSLDLEQAISNVAGIFYAIPAQGLRGIVRRVAGSNPDAPLHVSLAKGIEISTLMRPTEVMRDELPASTHDKISTLCGPSLAREVCHQMPTAVVAAAATESTAREVQTLLMSETFRVYTNSDVVGVELAGALKNVIAIAAGISDGLGYGDNTRGALITRGLAEIVRISLAMGATRETFAGLAGLGDLVTTCTSSQSRNHHVGVEIARGHPLAEITDEMPMVAEGVPTTRAAQELSVRHRVDMPIASEIHLVLFEGKNPRTALRDLMLRKPRAEVW